MGEEDRGRVWRLYGWFSGLMLCGSCVGVVTGSAKMMDLVYLYKGHDSSNKAERSSLLALSSSWYSAVQVWHAIEFLFLSSAKLMVLDRMSVFAAPQGTLMQKRWAAAGRIVMVFVVLSNSVGLAANVAAAVHYQRGSEADSTAAAYYAANNTNDGDNFRLRALEEWNLGGSMLSVQRFWEVAVLLLIVIAFVVVGVLSARRVSLALRGVEKMRAVHTFYNPGQAASPVLAEATMRGRALRLQIAGTTAFVFVAFLMRSVLSIMVAVSFGLRDIQQPCPGIEQFSFCAPCYNAFTHMSGWLNYASEFESTIVLISGPVALLVALWGMTTKSALQAMQSSGHGTAMSLIPPTAPPQC
jgi:hypothetical protein